MRQPFPLLACIALATLGCSHGGRIVSADLQAKEKSVMAVSADDFLNGKYIPMQHTASDGNVSPGIGWSKVPPDTKSIALIVEDSDADQFAHWVVYNIPASMVKLPERSLPATVMQGQNETGKIGYFGPQPPPGKVHHYHFNVYALDSELPLGPGATRNDVLKAMSGHVLAHAELIGLFRTGEPPSRKRP
jgi:Raf kinase inhibitor-like YbhB/YbcL family protein